MRRRRHPGRMREGRKRCLVDEFVYEPVRETRKSVHIEQSGRLVLYKHGGEIVNRQEKRATRWGQPPH